MQDTVMKRYWLVVEIRMKAKFKDYPSKGARSRGLAPTLYTAGPYSFVEDTKLYKCVVELKMKTRFKDECLPTHQH